MGIFRGHSKKEAEHIDYFLCPCGKIFHVNKYRGESLMCSLCGNIGKGYGEKKFKWLKKESVMNTKRYIVCYFCGVPATDDDYCYGCHHYVCLECHQTSIEGREHDVEEHTNQQSPFWLISGETYRLIVDTLELANSPGISLNKVRFAEALHALETGLHKTDAIPDDYINEEDYNKVFKDLGLEDEKEEVEEGPGWVEGGIGVSGG